VTNENNDITLPRQSVVSSTTTKCQHGDISDGNIGCVT